MASPYATDVVVIGANLSGLVAPSLLLEAGLVPDLYEHRLK